MVVSFIGGGNRSTRRKRPTCSKSLTNLTGVGTYNKITTTTAPTPNMNISCVLSEYVAAIKLLIYHDYRHKKMQSISNASKRTFSYVKCYDMPPVIFTLELGRFSVTMVMILARCSQ